MRSVLHEGTVRIGVAIAIPQLLESLGADPEAVFNEAEIDLELFSDPDNVVSYAARGHLLNVCADRTDCEHFGLLLGQYGSLSSFGLIGFLAQQSSDVGSALRSLQRYFHLHVQGARLEVTVEGRLARLSYNTYEPYVEAIRVQEDGAMAWALNVLRELCGSDFIPSEVSFVHCVPENPGLYRSFFQAPVSFNSTRDGLYFPAILLNKPVTRADKKLHRHLQKEVDRLQAKYRDGFLDHFKRVLHSVLWLRNATADDVASLFSISSRTLNRRLNSLGTTYQDVADEVRCQIACQLLSTSDLQLAEISELLHFFDASSFIKAFKRWTGTTPAKWRLRNKH